MNNYLSKKFKIIFCILCCFFFLFHSKIFAYNSGNCVNIDKETQRAIRIGNKISFVTKHSANTYTNEYTNRVDEHLDFNEKIWITGIGDNRVKVETRSGKEMWMNKTDLVCTEKPLKTKGKQGLEKKFIVLTESLRSEKKPTVKAYPDPDTELCNHRCKDLDRFTTYFIFDETDERYLLSMTYRLKDGQLIGWVEKKDGIVWTTALGLRPSEKLENKAIFAYESIESAKVKKDGRPVIGGKRWFEWDQRIPIIDKAMNDKYYEIVIPMPGISVKKGSTENSIIMPENFSSPDSGINAIKRKVNNVDFFFLIDGTRSMGEYINDVLKAIKTINNEIETSRYYDDIIMRYGFGIYRDGYAGDRELGDWFSFPQNCNMEKNDMQQNLKDFYSYLKQYKNSFSDATKGDPDFEENLFGGIKKAIEGTDECPGMADCPDNLKFLFIIGDHGYSKYTQQTHYKRKPIYINELVNKLKSNVVVYFIQVEINEKVRNADYGNQISEDTRLRSMKGYDRAYKLFKKQALHILKAMGRHYPNMNPNDHFFTDIQTGVLLNKIETTINQFSRNLPEIGREIEISLKSGSSLVQTIEKLQQYNKYRNLPGLFWDIIKEESCEELGDQCQNRVTDRVFKGFISSEDDIEIDVWCSAADLDKFLKVLDGTKDVGQSATGDILRKEMTNNMIKTLERLLEEPLYDDVKDESLSQYMERSFSLPVRRKSPLFQYSYDDLKNKIGACVIEALFMWTINIYDVLANVRANKQTSFKVIKNTNCSEASHIPYIIPNSIEGKPFPDGMGYSNDISKTTLYWIPEKFLP